MHSICEISVLETVHARLHVAQGLAPDVVPRMCFSLAPFTLDMAIMKMDTFLGEMMLGQAYCCELKSELRPQGYGIELV